MSTKSSGMRRLFRQARRAPRFLARLVVLLLGILALSYFVVTQSAQARLYDVVAATPHRRVGLVLGCSERLEDGRKNLFFSARVQAAAQLFHARKVDYLLVSGDNRTIYYDEPKALRKALVSLGVPADRIVLDQAGLRTLDSVVRAREIFGLHAFTIISQRFHNERALFIARQSGIDAIGYNAPGVTGFAGMRAQGREALARFRAILDVHVLGTKPRFLGQKVAIGKTSNS